MNNQVEKNDISQKAAHLEKELLLQYGLFVGGQALRKLLGYRSSASFRNAVLQGTLPVPSLFLPGRKGRLARVRDVALWLAEVDEMIEEERESMSRNVQEEQ